MEKMILVVDTTVVALLSMVVMRGVTVLEQLLKCHRDFLIDLSSINKDIKHLEKRVADIEQQQHLHCD